MLKNYIGKLKEIKKEMKQVGNNLIKANEAIVDAMVKCNKKKLESSKTYIKNTSDKITKIDHKIITTLALHSPEAKDLRAMISYLKITNELLKTASNTRSFAKGFSQVCTNLDDEMITKYIRPMQMYTIEAIKATIEMIDITCTDEAKENYEMVLVSESKAEGLYEIIENDIIKKSKEIGDFDTYHSILKTLRKIRKISERSVSVANLFLYANNGGELHSN